MLRNRPLVAVCVWVVVLFVVYEFVVGPRLPQSWLSYSTRPLWDKSDAPTELVDHFDRPGLSSTNTSQEWCGLHQWKARTEQVQVWDAVSCAVKQRLATRDGLDSSVRISNETN